MITTMTAPIVAVTMGARGALALCAAGEASVAALEAAVDGTQARCAGGS